MTRALPCLVLLACGVFATLQGIAGEESIELRNAPGRELTATRCAMCHSLDYIEMNAPLMNRNGWQKTVQKMVDRFGAPLTKEEAGEILEYLGSQYSGAQ